MLSFSRVSRRRAEPGATFRGLRNVGSHEWMCPSGKINQDHRSDGHLTALLNDNMGRLNGQTHAVRLQNKDTHVSALALSHDICLTPSGAATSSKLIFAFNGQQRVLHQAVIEGDDHIHDLLHGDEVAELKKTPQPSSRVPQVSRFSKPGIPLPHAP